MLVTNFIIINRLISKIIFSCNISILA